jgi:phage shock protein PspC (stress-responsive transcriptional regulator)
MDTTAHTPAAPPPDPGPRRLTRSSRDRIIGGVGGGLGRYFGIDPTLVRIGFVALALLGGTGLVVYVAALLLVPLDEEAAGTPRTARGFGFAFGGALVPVAFAALAGLAVWWLVAGEQPTGGAGDVVRRAAQGFGLLLGCAALAVASFFASGLGGGVVVAGIVIAAGAGLVAAAFVGGARWLVLPALAIALPLAFVAAAGIDLDGGFGDRREHPTSLAELEHGYRLGAGQLVVDLRNLDLPSGDHPLRVRIGTGHALVLVPEDVCVASRASVGMGAVAVFDRDSGGIDVDWNDSRRARRGAARLVLDGDVGLGLLEVRHEEYGRRGHHGPWEPGDPDERNAACTASA